MGGRNLSLSRTLKYAAVKGVGVPAADSPAHYAVRGMQTLVLAVLAVGVLTRNPSVVVNAVLGFLVTLLPGVLERDYSVTLGPGPALWLTTAVLLHSVGMLGLYDAVGWWDHLTHTLSATVAAGAAYAVVHAIDIHEPHVYLPPTFMGVFLLLTTLGLGVVWEALEFVARELAIALDMEPVLILYGVDDTIVDLVYDALGGLLVAWLGTERLDRLSAVIEARLG